MFEKILVAAEGSQLSRRAVEMATDLAAEFGATLVIVYVIDQRVFYEPHEVVALVPENPYFKILDELMQGAQQLLAGFVAQAQQKGISVKSKILEGNVVDEIIKAVRKEKANLLVIGAHGKSRRGTGLLGTTAQGVVQQAPCNLLIVRQ